MKSLYQRLGEAVEKLTDAGKFKEYREASADCTSTESKLNLAEKLLRAPVRESRAPITKHNGAGDNGGELITESLQRPCEESGNPLEKQVKSYMLTCNCTEARARQILGLPPKGLTRAEAAEYLMSIRFGLSEADALRLCKKTAR